MAYLHLDVKDTSLLLDLLLDGSHGLVQNRQSLCALQSGRCHHVTRRSDQVNLQTQDHISFYDLKVELESIRTLSYIPETLLP